MKTGPDPLPGITLVIGSGQSTKVFIPSHQDSGGTNQIAAMRYVMCPKVIDCMHYPLIYHVTNQAM